MHHNLPPNMGRRRSELPEAERIAVLEVATQAARQYVDIELKTFRQLPN